MKEIPTHSFPFKHQLYLFNSFVPYTTSPGLTVHSLAQYDSRILPLMLDIAKEYVYKITSNACNLLYELVTSEYSLSYLNIILKARVIE